MDETSLRRSLSLGLLAEHGQAIVSGVLKAVLFCLPAYMHPDMAEILFELMRVDRPVCLQSFNALIVRHIADNMSAFLFKLFF